VLLSNPMFPKWGLVGPCVSFSLDVAPPLARGVLRVGSFVN